MTSVTCGAVLLAGGLVGMALLPSRSLGWVLAALVLCGAGIGVTVPPLTELALAGSAQPDAAGTWTVASRHAGLVAGLVLLTPLLARDLVAAAGRAERAGAAVVLDAPLSLESKVPLAVDLAREIERTPRGSLPSFDREFARRQAAAGDERPALIDLHRALDATVLAVVTRSFRRAFVLAALVALLALTALPFVGGRSHA